MNQKNDIWLRLAILFLALYIQGLPCYAYSLHTSPTILYTHSDHLGSASWITEGSGVPLQYIHYLPYGQLLANQRLYRYDERYKFTGKERDFETGYDYFGARYYSPLLMHFTSVEPLLDKYLDISPYSYAAWNPIKYVDSDGRWVHIPIGAAIGGVVGGLFALKEGKAPSEVGAAFLGGAVAGGISAATAGLGSGIIASMGYGALGGVIGGAAGNLTEQSINVATGNQNELDIEIIGESALVGAITEGAGGAIGTLVSQSSKNIVNKIEARYQSESMQKSLRTEIKKEFPFITKQDVNRLVKQRSKKEMEFDVGNIKGTEFFLNNIEKNIMTSTIENEYK